MRKKAFSYPLNICLIFYFSITVYADNGDLIVHRTKTGSKYHSAGCGYLRSDIPVTLHDAVVIYNLPPCSRCNPPIYSVASTAPSQGQITRTEIDAIYDPAPSKSPPTYKSAYESCSFCSPPILTNDIVNTYYKETAITSISATTKTFNAKIVSKVTTRCNTTNGFKI